MSWVTKMIVFRSSLDPEQLVLKRPRDRVERAEGLVHQHQRRVGRERAGEPDPLALAAGELGRVAGAVVAGGQVDEVEQPSVRCPLTLRPAEQPRHGRDVLGDRHMGEEPDLLDHVMPRRSVVSRRAP